MSWIELVLVFILVCLNNDVINTFTSLKGKWEDPSFQHNMKCFKSCLQKKPVCAVGNICRAFLTTHETKCSGRPTFWLLRGIVVKKQYQDFLVISDTWQVNELPNQSCDCCKHYILWNYTHILQNDYTRELQCPGGHSHCEILPLGAKSTFI